MLNLNELNEAQRQAVTHGEGPLLVLAGPGSGKTFTITGRIQYLIQEQEVPAEQILVITFTKAAAESMKSRFEQHNSESVPFGTFHSCFYNFLRETGRIEPGRFWKLSRKRAVLEQVISSYDAGTLRPVKAQIDDLLSLIGYCKNTAVSGRIEAISSPQGHPLFLTLPGNWQKDFLSIFRSYEAIRRQTGGYDYDDILFDCLREMEENHSFREYWQGRFRHILVDEMQDINPVQYGVLKQLASAPYNLFAVGDDDQSIYGFRGARPECLKWFQEDFRTKLLVLDVNYRSTGQIVRLSQQMIGESKNRFEKNYRAAEELLQESTDRQKAEKGVFPLGQTKIFHEFIQREEMYAYLMRELEQVPGGETVGVLFRTNTLMQSCARRLHKRGIPFQVKEGRQNPYDHFIVKDILAYLELSKGMPTREHFIQIMNKPLRYISREALRQEPFCLQSVRDYYVTGINRENIRRNLDKLLNQLDYINALSLPLAVNYILKVVGYERYCKQEAGNYEERQEEYQELMEWLCEEAARYGDLTQWKVAIESYEQGNATSIIQREEKGEGTQEMEQREEYIQLMTVHGAKGLEFDRVYIPECNEKVYPKGNLPDAVSCEEERRILYVAMTRAKKSLEILYTVGTKERPRLPSRFIYGINQKQFRQIHCCPGTRQTCPLPSRTHHHPQYNPEQAPR